MSKVETTYTGYPSDKEYESLGVKDNIVFERSKETITFEYSFMVFAEDDKLGEWKQTGTFYVTDPTDRELIANGLWERISYGRELIRVQFPDRFPNESLAAVAELLVFDAIKQIVAHTLQTQ